MEGVVARSGLHAGGNDVSDHQWTGALHGNPMRMDGDHHCRNSEDPCPPFSFDRLAKMATAGGTSACAAVVGWQCGPLRATLSSRRLLIVLVLVL